MAELRNISSWMAENEKFFAPPVCNKLMYISKIYEIVRLTRPGSARGS